MTERFNILALSGGGFLGLYTVAVLAGLEKAKQAPIARSFDLLAGTSVGGIVALGLAAEVPAAKILAAFERNGIHIFSNRPAPTTLVAALRDLPRFLFKPKYNADALRTTIIEVVGDGRRIGDLQHRVIIPTVNLTKGRPQVFKTAHHPTFGTDLNCLVADVALATSAAPTYFPIAEVGDALYADGGLYANSPDMLALHEAEHFLAAPRETIHLLSVGTTTSEFSFAHAHGRQFGLFQWARDQRLVNVMIASQQHSVNYMMGHRLADRYQRLDASQSKDQQSYLALDVATDHAQKTIRGLAAATVQASLADPRTQGFLDHTAAPPKFHHSGGS